MKFEIFKLKSVTSTNDEAVNFIKNKKREIGCVYAETQTKGRGTQGKRWISEEGNLFGSIFFPLKKEYPPFNEFSIINPVLISKVIEKFCSEKKITLKWPNDVFIEGKKICGILQETIVNNNTKFLIIGIGINLTTSPYVNPNYRTTSIFEETKKKLTNKEIINLLVESYEKFFVNLNMYNFSNFKIKADLMAVN